MFEHGLRFRVTSFMIVTMLSTMAWGQSTLVERSFQKLQQSPPSDPGHFDFIVVGDSNTLKPLVQSDIFRQSLKEFNILEPSFVLEVGDIIVGGDAEGVPAQWDVFDEVIATCEPPYLPLPGNHDISDKRTEQIWLNRIGPTHYAFHYGNSFFILLNSEEVGALDRISDEQVAWLRAQLASASATNVFVFLHKPYFAHDGDPDAAAELWDEQWANVADALHGYPVRVVFAGHWHGYLDCGTREGVRYVICAGASTYGMRGSEEEGKFNHYLWVRVRGEDVSWAVIKPFSILPEDAATSDRLDELYRIRNQCIAAQEVFVPLGHPVDDEVTITIRNPHDAPLQSVLTWDAEPGWTVSPLETGYDIPSQGAADLAFRIRADKPEDARYPVPAFRTLYKQTQFGPAVDVEQDLKLVPTMSASRLEGGITVDGVLDEWGTAQRAPLTYPVGFDAEDTDDLGCELGFLWDDQHLYLAVETQDNEHHQPYAGDIVWSADNVEMFLGDWSWGLSLTEKGPEVFLYWGVDVSAETVNTDVRLAVKRDGTKVIYEAAFPQSRLTPLKLSRGSSFRFNCIMNDLDASGPKESRHWLELMPGAGSIGGRAPRVKVVLD